MKETYQETRRNETKIELVFLANTVPIANKVHGFFCCFFNFTVIDLSKKKKKTLRVNRIAMNKYSCYWKMKRKKKRSV